MTKFVDFVLRLQDKSTVDPPIHDATSSPNKISARSGVLDMILPSRKSGPVALGRVSSGGNSNDDELIERLFMKAAEGVTATEGTRRRKMKQISSRITLEEA